MSFFSFIFLLVILFTILSIDARMKRFIHNQELLMEKLDKTLELYEKESGRLTSHDRT